MLSGGSGGTAVAPGLVRDDESARRPIGDPELAAMVDELEDLTRRMGEYDTSRLSEGDRVALLVRSERVTRARIGQGHVWLAQVVGQGGFSMPGVRTADALSLVLNIDRSAASRRLSDAVVFGDRYSMAGDPLDPQLPAAAAQLRSGAIDPAHAEVIRRLARSLPTSVDPGTLANAEAHLAAVAVSVRPSELRVLADRIREYIVEEGGFDTPPAVHRKRGVFVNGQDADGMWSGRFVLDAETYAYAAAIAAKLARPGMCNPDDAKPRVDDASSTDASSTDASGTEAPARGTRDVRTRPQRLHDALTVVLRQMLASGELGQHRGLPVTVVVTASLDDLERGAGIARTSTGGFLPIRDVIRMATHAYHYLAIFGDDGCPLHLGRSKRIASEHQRIVLVGSDRGCSAPGCDRPASMSQVHHIDEWQRGGATDIESLTFVCDRHHPMVNDGPLGWATSKVPAGEPYAGRTQWHPPKVVDPTRAGRVNHLHHPEDFLLFDCEDPPPEQR